MCNSAMKNVIWLINIIVDVIFTVIFIYLYLLLQLLFLFIINNHIIATF